MKKLSKYKEFNIATSQFKLKTHRLLELYRFLDFHSTSNQRQSLAIDTSLWKTFLNWNGCSFWSGRSNITRNFITPAKTYLDDPILARNELDMTKKSDRRTQSTKKQNDKRRKRSNEKKLSIRSIRRISKNAFTSLGTQWDHYGYNNHHSVIKHFLTRCGKAGECFLRNNEKDCVVENVSAFMKTLSHKHSAKNIQGVEIVKASLSGPNIEPLSLRKLVAPSSRLEGWQKARDRRVHKWGDIKDLLDSQIYSREPKFPKAVPQLICNLAMEYSSEDPSVGKIRDWVNPWTGESITLGRRWTMSSQKELAVQLLTLFREKFQLAMGTWPPGSTRVEAAISRRRVGKDSAVPSERYIVHVLSK